MGDITFKRFRRKKIRFEWFQFYNVVLNSRLPLRDSWNIFGSVLWARHICINWSFRDHQDFSWSRNSRLGNSSIIPDYSPISSAHWSTSCGERKAVYSMKCFFSVDPRQSQDLTHADEEQSGVSILLIVQLGRQDALNLPIYLFHTAWKHSNCCVVRMTCYVFWNYLANPIRYVPFSVE